MDTKPIRELVELVNEAIRDCELENKVSRSTRFQLEKAIAAAERALAEMESCDLAPMEWLRKLAESETTAKTAIEALRLADELSGSVIADSTKNLEVWFLTARTKARAYRKARGLE